MAFEMDNMGVFGNDNEIAAIRRRNQIDLPASNESKNSPIHYFPLYFSGISFENTKNGGTDTQLP